MVTSASYYFPILAISVNYVLPILILIIYLIDMRNLKKNNENKYIYKTQILKSNQKINLYKNISGFTSKNQIIKFDIKQADNIEPNLSGSDILLKSEKGFKGGEYEIKD